MVALDIPGGPAVKTLPSNAEDAGSLVRELRSHVPCSQKIIPNRNSIITNSIKTLKMGHIKKKFFFLKEGVAQQRASSGRALHTSEELQLQEAIVGS